MPLQWQIWPQGRQRALRRAGGGFEHLQNKKNQFPFNSEKHHFFTGMEFERCLYREDALRVRRDLLTSQSMFRHELVVKLFDSG